MESPTTCHASVTGVVNGEHGVHPIGILPVVILFVIGPDPDVVIQIPEVSRMELLKIL
jgi:hypothetical protein